MRFEPTISAGVRPQTYALERVDAGTGSIITCCYECKDEIRLVLFLVCSWGRHITDTLDCCAADLLTSRLSRMNEYCCVTDWFGVANSSCLLTTSSHVSNFVCDWLSLLIVMFVCNVCRWNVDFFFYYFKMIHDRTLMISLWEITTNRLIYGCVNSLYCKQRTIQ
jgi:hypothetical protein